MNAIRAGAREPQLLRRMPLDLRNTDNVTTLGRDGSANASLDAAVTRVVERLRHSAADPGAFGALMRQSFGDDVDAQAVERLRTRIVSGDIRWLPNFRAVEAPVLDDAVGLRSGAAAYVEQTDTVLVSRVALHGDPLEATDLVAEELGHALDVRLNATDTQGDEGEVFARLSAGEILGADTLSALRREDDHGEISLDGQRVAVEYSWLGAAVDKVSDTISGGVKAAADAVGSVLDRAGHAISNIAGEATERIENAADRVQGLGERVVDGLKSLGRGIERGFERAMNSELLQRVMTVASFAPIPALQLVARGYALAQGAYSAYQGMKHGSLGMVLSGIAGTAGGICKFGQMLGNARVADIAGDVAYWSRAGALVHRAAATRDFATAAEAFGMALGRSDSTALRRLSQIGHLTAGVLEARELVQRGEWMQVALAAADIVGHDDLEALMQRVGGRAADLATLSDRLDAGDYRGAATLFNARFLDRFGLSEYVQATLYRAAALLEQRDAIEALLSDKDRDDPAVWRRVDQSMALLDIALHADDRRIVDRIFLFRDAIEAGNLSSAFDILRAGVADLDQGRTTQALDATATMIDELVAYARTPFSHTPIEIGSPSSGTPGDAVGQ